MQDYLVTARLAPVVCMIITVVNVAWRCRGWALIEGIVQGVSTCRICDAKTGDEGGGDWARKKRSRQFSRELFGYEF